MVTFTEKILNGRLQFLCSDLFEDPIENIKIALLIWNPDSQISTCNKIIDAKYDLNVFIRAYNLIINRMTRSENMMENNNQIDYKILWKTNISSLHFERHLRRICKFT